MSGKVIQTFFIIIFLVTLTLLIIPNNATAIGEPEVNLRFKDGENVQIAKVGPGDPHTATFQCTVSVEDTIGVGVQGVSIELESSSEQGWGSSVAPSLFYLYPGNSADFNVSVTAPFGTSSEIEDTGTITGHAEYSSGGTKSKITPIYGTIKIKPYYMIILNSIKDHIRTSPGTEANFVISIENNGNSVNRVTIELEENDELEELGCDLVLSDTMIAIPEKENRTVEITAIVPEYLTRLNAVRTYELKITVFSEEMFNEITNQRIYQFSLEIYQKDIYLTYEFVFSTIIIIAILIGAFIFKRRRKSRRQTEK